MTTRLLCRPFGFTSCPGYVDPAYRRLIVPSRQSGGLGGIKETIHGWTQKSRLNNLHFLQSVDWPHLGGDLVAVTLTLRDKPTGKQWRELVKALCKYIRQGFGDLPAGYAYHWVLEMQKRGVPHLHLIVLYRKELPYYAMIRVGKYRGKLICPAMKGLWLHLAGDYRPEKHAQRADLVYGPSWLLRLEIGDHLMGIGEVKAAEVFGDAGIVNFDYDKLADVFAVVGYQAKHQHMKTDFQRAGDPAQWENYGKVWSKGGDWPIVKAGEYIIEDEQAEILVRAVVDFMVKEETGKLEKAVTDGVKGHLMKRVEYWQGYILSRQEMAVASGYPVELIPHTIDTWAYPFLLERLAAEQGIKLVCQPDRFSVDMDNQKRVLV